MAGARVIAYLAVASVIAAGSPVPAPAGFLDLCRRSPADCASEATSPDALAGVSGEATRIFWQRTFDEAGREVAIAAGDIASSPALTALPHPSGSALSAEDMTAQIVARTPRLTQSLRREIEAANRRVNRSMRARSDADVFGKADYWHGEGGLGDCEDFALAKRRALVAAGVSPALLSIALVRTAPGEAHAVLLVADDDDAIVLDNLTPWILRPSQTAYRWVSRQRFGDPLEWVSLASEAPTVADGAAVQTGH